MSAKIINIAVLLILVVLALGLFANSMAKPLGRDEQMYCTAGALLAQGRMIYRDFSYAAQMPYHPLLYATAFRILNTTRYLLVGRIISSLCDILVMLCIVGIYRHIFKSFAVSAALLGLAGAVLYVFNPLADYANGYAWNHDVVILCVVASFWLFISTDFQKTKYLRIAAIGALLTLATCMRITTVLVELLFFVCLLLRPAGSLKQRLKTALPFLVAAACVLIWPLWVIAHAPRAFFLNLVTIPTLYGQWLHEIGMVHNKFGLTYSCLTTPGYFALIVLTIYLCAVVLALRIKLTVSHKKKQFRDPSHVPRVTGDGLLAALLPLFFFIIALIPPTMWRQYLAMPVPFLVIGCAYPLLYLKRLTGKTGPKKNRNTTSLLAVALVIFSAFTAIVSYPVVLKRILVLTIPESWEPVRFHKTSEDIAEQLNTKHSKLKTQNSKLILTLAPLLALEGGCDIYTELSAGSIIYRIADLLQPDDRRITHTAGPQTIASILEKNPPSAVILGLERGKLATLEDPLQAIVKPDWQRKSYDNGLIVYFRP